MTPCNETCPASNFEQDSESENYTSLKAKGWTDKQIEKWALTRISTWSSKIEQQISSLEERVSDLEKRVNVNPLEYALNDEANDKAHSNFNKRIKALEDK